MKKLLISLLALSLVSACSKSDDQEKWKKPLRAPPSMLCRVK